MAWGTKKPTKAGGRYLITLVDTVRQADLCEHPKGNLYWGILPSGSEGIDSGRVTAWQKQPKPYKP